MQALGLLLLGGGAAAATTALSGGFDKSEPMPMPQAPDTSKAEGAAKDETKRRKQAVARSKSIFTSPLGLADQADIGKKTLLGQ